MRFNISDCGLLCVATLIGLSSCHSPEVNVYTLDAARAPQATEIRSSTVLVGLASLPEVVDRPQLVVREGNYKVHVLEGERWASPLKEALPRLIADELNQRVPDVRFVSSTERALADPTGRLLIDITRFDVTRVGGAHVVAHWLYRPADPQSKPSKGASDVEAKATAPGNEGLVQALQRASLALADDIAGRLAK